jgi:hypothetical protein
MAPTTEQWIIIAGACGLIMLLIITVVIIGITIGGRDNDRED